MVGSSSKLITIEEFLELPETKPPGEYIDGQIIQKPMLQGEHSAIQTELAAALNANLKPQKIARAFCELRCTFGDRSILPDISVFVWDRIPRRENGRILNAFEIDPSWTIEILSPQQSQTKVTRNIIHCLHNGTQLGWLIDSQEQSVLVYYPQQLPEFFEAENDILPVPEFAKSVELTLGKLFGWLFE